MESDEKLLARFQKDPEKAFPDVFRVYYSAVCSQVYRILGNASEVEDVAQDIFFELYQKKNHLTIRSSLRAYLNQMARTRTLNHIRNKKWKWKEDEAVLEKIEDRKATVDMKMEAESLEEHLSAAIDGLPPKCRLIFGLRRFEGMSTREIADQLEKARDVDQVVQIVTSHLERFAFRENPKLAWKES